MARYNTIGKVATHIRTFGGATEVQYHHTVVVEFDATHIRLNSGGWRTATTKVRMNQTANQFGLGFGVFQHKGEWFVDFAGKRLPFVDDMVLSRIPERDDTCALCDEIPVSPHEH